MSQVVIGEHQDPKRAMQNAIDELGFAFVDKVKAARSILIVGGDSMILETLIGAIELNTRTPIYLLSMMDKNDCVEATIPRGDDVRMSIKRPAIIEQADFVISIVSMPIDRKRKTELSIERFVFDTWIVPNRSTSSAFKDPHDPWMEGDLRNLVIADLYSQRAIDLAFIDGTLTTGKVLASFDAVALDTIGLRLLGIDADGVGYLQILMMKGLGESSIAKIDVPLGVIASSPHV